jgi:hypothetical protein
MKINHIKKILIGDTMWEVRWDKKKTGGEFSYVWPEKKIKPFIRISVKEEKLNPIATLNIIIHELKEIIHVEQATRFKRSDEGDAYEFHYTHREHTELCSRLAGLLNEFIK